MSRANFSANASMIAMGAIPSANERRLGRFIRDGEGHEQNNTGGEQGGNKNNESNNNNTGQEFDPSSFWQEPAEESSAPKKTVEGQEGNQAKPGNEDSSNQLGTKLSQQIQGFAAKEVFTAEVVEGINEGDFSKFDANLSKAMQSSMEQNLQMTVQVMQQFGTKMMEAIEAKINSSFTSKENYDELHTQIPSAKNPAVAPIVKSIYDRALVLAKGDKTKAVTMTKNMLNSMASETGKDAGLHVAPVGSESNFGGSGPKTNWLEELNQS